MPSCHRQLFDIGKRRACYGQALRIDNRSTGGQSPIGAICILIFDRMVVNHSDAIHDAREIDGLRSMSWNKCPVGRRPYLCPLPRRSARCGLRQHLLEAGLRDYRAARIAHRRIRLQNPITARCILGIDRMV